jgi:cytochrome c553
MLRVAAGLLAVSWIAHGPALHARPAHKKAMAEYFGKLLPARLNACTTCHQAARPTEESHEHNAFGKRLAEVRDQLKKAGKKTDIVSRIRAIADEDSDGDGVSNLLELLSGHNPGDPKDKPNGTELAAARAAAKELQNRAGYAWKPFEVVQRPPVPQVARADWSRNPIDAFLAAEHEKRGLQPRPEAPKYILLRRVYLDVIGLPPTREELHAFLADESPLAYEKVVDRLLESPAYGERWGRHWMDVWRYADWAGFGEEVRESQRHIWHWRDWIIESLNADKGYDRMILEMLAGDELAPTDPNTLRATGFLVRPWFLFNRNTWLDNAVEHTAKAFLGVTLNCARCHEHKYDPIEQEEYYRFRAFFEPYHVRIDRVPGEADLNKAGIPRVFDAYLDAKTFRFERGNEAHPDKNKPLEPAVPVALGGRPIHIEPITLPAKAYRPDKREFIIRETLRASKAQIEQARAKRTAAYRHSTEAIIAALGLPTVSRPAMQPYWNQAAGAHLELALAEAEDRELQATMHVEQLEDARRKDSAEWQKAATLACTLQRTQAVAKARLEVWQVRQALTTMPNAKRAEATKRLAEAESRLAKAEQESRQPPTTKYTPRAVSYPQAPPSYGKTTNAPYPHTSTGRRLALARWIADRQNPLTARVAMNHIWMRHFGKPLVATVFDFGANGQPPTHPALLDWLAAEFMEHGWSMKHMHRLILTSRAYRMDSNSDPANASRDPDNRFVWRMNSRRVEAETVRDSVLAAAGRLDRRVGGPDIDQNLGQSVHRRSLYFRHAAEKQMEFLLVFDAASVTECYRRTESVIPQQALALANSTLAQEQARLLARDLAKQTTDIAAFIRLAFEQVLSRLPTEAEQRECQRFLVEQTSLLAGRAKLSAFTSGPPSTVPPSPDPGMRAREDLIGVLLNHHEFVTMR